MKQQIIAMATPTLGVITMKWHKSMQELQWVNNTGKAEIEKYGLPVAEARNEIVALVRKKNKENQKQDITHIFWVDDDVLIGKFSLIALYKHYADIASGVYFTKETELPLIYPGRGCGVGYFIPGHVYKEIWGHGLGLCLIKTSVYDKIAEMGIPNDKFGNPEFHRTDMGKNEWNEDGYWDKGGTEDLFFCNLKEKAGFTSVVDCTDNCFGWHIDKNTGKVYPQKQLEMLRKHEPVMFDTPQGPMELHP